MPDITLEAVVVEGNKFFIILGNVECCLLTLCLFLISTHVTWKYGSACKVSASTEGICCVHAWQHNDAQLSTSVMTQVFPCSNAIAWSTSLLCPIHSSASVLDSRGCAKCQLCRGAFWISCAHAVCAHSVFGNQRPLWDFNRWSRQGLALMHFKIPKRG